MVVESPATAGFWKVKYADGGVMEIVDRDRLSTYELVDKEWASGEWYAVDHLVASGEEAVATPQEACECTVRGGP